MQTLKEISRIASLNVCQFGFGSAGIPRDSLWAKTRTRIRNEAAHTREEEEKRYTSKCNTCSTHPYTLTFFFIWSYQNVMIRSIFLKAIPSRHLSPSELGEKLLTYKKRRKKLEYVNGEKKITYTRCMVISLIEGLLNSDRMRRMRYGYIYIY